jgi:hypothetical protein
MSCASHWCSGGRTRQKRHHGETGPNPVSTFASDWAARPIRAEKRQSRCLCRISRRSSKQPGWIVGHQDAAPYNAMMDATDQPRLT